MRPEPGAVPEREERLEEVLLSYLQAVDAGHTPDPRDVLARHLRGADLMVLSACETGMGAYTITGEGMRSLQHACHTAGARTLVASLWQVNDAATSVLMEEFYANLWQKKLPKLEALRQAQLTVLREPERVRQRIEELRKTLAKRGLTEKELSDRGLGKEAVELPPEGARRGPPAWWAAFVLSGDER